MMKMSSAKYPALILCLILSVTDAKYNKPVLMPSSKCGNNPLEIDGATVSSTTNSLYENSACVIKFKADDGYTSKRISANLSDVRINDCNKKLSLYFSSSSNGIPDVTLDCRSGPRAVVTSNSKYLTLRLDGSLRYPDRFKIILTSVKTTSYCSEFKCDNGNCIDDDLECDAIDHCFDGSDEKVNLSTGLCVKYVLNDSGDIEGAVKMGMGIIFAIVIGIIVICVFGCVLLICCCYRRRQSRGTVIRGPPVSQTTTTTNVAPQQPQNAGYQSGYAPPPAPGGYPPAQPAYPPTVQPGGYPPPMQQPGGYPQQPGGYPQQPAAYPQYPTGPVAPPAYHDKPYTDSAPYPQTAQVQYTASPPDVKMPTAPPKC